MDTKAFFQKLETFCKSEHTKNKEDICHTCELLNFCYSPPCDFVRNCDIDKVIQFVNDLKD